jgi:SAM-dependent methyltransferase
MIVEDARRCAGPPSIVDIGCSKGFDDDVGIQRSIAEGAGRYIGVEPDQHVSLGPYFGETHRCRFEYAPIERDSVDIAFAVMVLEHIADPQPFCEKLKEVLVEGGVFWGFTMDARHYFCAASRWADRLSIKNWYLHQVIPAWRPASYDNYPVHYRFNTPEQVRKHTSGFRTCDFISFSKIGQLNHYVPPRLRPITDFFDRRAIARRKPGSILAIRLVK